MTDMPEQDRITAGLRRIRTLRKTLLVVVITFAPVVYLMSLREIPLQIVMTVGIVWICAGVVIELMIGFARCPACRGYFHVKKMNGNIFTRKCMNCGIPLKGEE